MIPFIRRHPDLTALTVLTLVCALVFWPLISGQTYYYGDLQLYFHPMATFWKGELAQGRVPLWNPGILAGTPFVGSPQMWILYPGALLFLVFPAITALAVSTALHLWLGGAFFYGWTRRGRLRLPAMAALLGACVWMLCGAFVAKAQFPNMLQAIAWLPAVLWAGERVAARADARGTLVLALVLGVQLLAAHAQISLFSLYMLMIYLPYCRLQSPTRPALWRLGASVFGALVLAGLLAMGQLLPVVEALGATQRQALSLSQASRFVVVPWALVTLVAPHYYGNPMTGNFHYPKEVNFWESVIYLGIAPLGLAILAVWREPRARFWACWNALFLWLSFGLSGLLWMLAYYLVPGLSRFHDAGRFGILFSLGMAVTAALGAAQLQQWRGRRWVALALLLTVADLGVFARGVYPFRSVALAATPPLALWGRDQGIETRQARLWEQDFPLIWDALQPNSDYRQNDEANTSRLLESAIYNRHLLAGWLAESGYEPMYGRASKARQGALVWSARATAFPPDFAARAGRFSIGMVQLMQPQPFAATPDLKLVYASPWASDRGRLYYYRNLKALPRARASSDGKTWQRAQILRETASSIALEVTARARTVELADSMRPGWHAYLDGASITIETTAEGFRRVQLPPANRTRRVNFVYAPMPWKLGVWVSLCALGFCSASWIATRKR